jgi:hypothetical protein
MLSYDDVRARISSLPLGKKLEVRFHYDDDPEVRTSFGMLDRILHDGEQLFVLSVSCGRRKSEATPFFQNGIVYDLVRAVPKSHSRDRDDDDGLRPPARRQPPADDDFAPRPLPAAPAALAPSASSPAAVDAALLASIVAATVAAIRSSDSHQPPQPPTPTPPPTVHFVQPMPDAQSMWAMSQAHRNEYRPFWDVCPGLAMLLSPADVVRPFCPPHYLCRGLARRCGIRSSITLASGCPSAFPTLKLGSRQWNNLQSLPSGCLGATKKASSRSALCVR